MKTLFLSLFALLAFTSSSFAIDQVILKDGTVVEGKVLDDVPNRHVDLRLNNGTTRRFQQTEVSSIERDVPSTHDHDALGSESRVFLGANLGGYLNTNATNSQVLFNWGARFGVNTAQMGDFAKFAVALAYNRTAASASDITGSASASVNQFMVEFLFRKVANSGFYFGPELGLAIISVDVSTINLSGTGSSTQFDIGGLAGYDYYFSSSFSIGPEVHYTHFDNNSIMKFLLGGTFHFE